MVRGVEETLITKTEYKKCRGNSHSCPEGQATEQGRHDLKETCASDKPCVRIAQYIALCKQP